MVDGGEVPLRGARAGYLGGMWTPAPNWALEGRTAEPFGWMVGRLARQDGVASLVAGLTPFG